jgi:peroxiredoxin Q/BCP
MARIAEGRPAPALALDDASGRRVSLADFRGRDVVVYFYSRDDTPGCTKEACGFRDLLSDPDRTVMTAGGAYGDKVLYGKKTKGVIRSTVWVGPDGSVRKHWKKVADAAKHPAQVLETLRRSRE